MTLQELHDFTGALIEEGHDPGARVLIAEQPSWPFEYLVQGVCTREDIQADQDDEADNVDGPPVLREEQRTSDVVIAAGNQLCYGEKATWEAAKTYRS